MIYFSSCYLYFCNSCPCLYAPLNLFIIFYVFIWPFIAQSKKKSTFFEYLKIVFCTGKPFYTIFILTIILLSNLYTLYLNQQYCLYCMRENECISNIFSLPYCLNANIKTLLVFGNNFEPPTIKRISIIWIDFFSL